MTRSLEAMVTRVLALKSEEVQAGKEDGTGLGKSLKCPGLKEHRQETAAEAREPWERPLACHQLSFSAGELDVTNKNPGAKT